VAESRAHAAVHNAATLARQTDCLRTIRVTLPSPESSTARSPA
jgi:hypothetical protein